MLMTVDFKSTPLEPSSYRRGLFSYDEILKDFGETQVLGVLGVLWLAREKVDPE